ncbi:6-bladed beta-propeller [Colwellia sp. RE-S-Sl-9]
MSTIKNAITPPHNLTSESIINPHGMIVGEGKFKYRINTNWGKLDPAKIPVENCHDITLDSKDRVIMVTDNIQNNFIIYNKNGELLEHFGTEFPGAHAIKIVHENSEDFMYIVDSGWKLNRNWDGVTTGKPDSPYNKVIGQSGFIAKLNMQGDIIFTIGHPQTIGIYTPDMPFKPTDIAIAPNGDIYITDGYGSDYLIQYDSQGRYIHHWGGHDNTDTHLNLSNTHGINIDLRNPLDPHLVVSSRAERALKLFSLNGEYRKTISVPGAWIGGPVFKGEYFYAPVCWSDVDGKKTDNSGFISIFDKNNQVIANIGGEKPIYINGELQPMKSTKDIFHHCHGVCVDDDGNLYVSQWKANHTYPIKLEKI